MTTQTVASLASLVEGRVIGDGTLAIRGVADLRSAGPQHIGFVRDVKYRDAAKLSSAGALITPIDLETRAAQILVADVGLAFAKVALHFHPLPRAVVHSVHKTAVVHPEAVLEEPLVIGPNVVIGRARIGRGSVLMAGVSIGDGCQLAADCVIFPNVVLYHGVTVGARVVMHSGTVIGSDGFGYVRDDATFHKVPQLGGVQIGDDVEIGANCTIDRGAIGDTKIGARNKLDNLCHFAHNCVTGEDCAFAAGALIAGSTIIGNRVIMGGHVLTSGHLRVVDDVRVAGNSALLRDIDKPGDYMGYPAQEKLRFLRQMKAVRELVEMKKAFEALSKRVESLLPPPPSL
jgi:UDP-3-O-[3-hydroxymyristoyl] glucosamine N-acyltransferase